MVAIGQEENEMRITADGEDPINGKGPAAERVSRIDNRDLTRDAINNRGILLSLVLQTAPAIQMVPGYWSG
jgi:hypothetical protein